MNVFWKLMLCCLVCLGFSFQGAQAHPARKPGMMQVAVDNGNNPVEYSYVLQGHNDGRPVIVFVDPYFGIEGCRCLQEKFSDDFFTISLDILGSGLSSKNDPLLMDGVAGEQGFSFKQQAIFSHTLLQNLGVNGPITWVGVDSQSQVGMRYAVEFANQPYALSKIVIINPSMYELVGNNPCSLPFLSSEQATALSQFYATDPCDAICALLVTSFITTDCPEAENILKSAATRYVTTTPANIFARILTQTYTESVIPLMSQINIPVLALYGSTGDVNPLSRKSLAVSFVGLCPACPDFNPTVGVCPCGATTPVPFSDIRFVTYPGHGTCLHLSAFKKFSKDLKKFVTGKDSKCTLCPVQLNNLTDCPDCPI